MARKVFFSFHFERDSWRAGQVRNSWVTKPDRQTAGFWDAVAWEEVRRKGDESIKKWIDNQLNGTSVTVVLIGTETNSRPYVNYEIEQSYKIGNGLLGIYIHNVKDRLGRTDLMGLNPFNYWHITKDNQIKYFSQMYSTYDWVSDRGYDNLGIWIENAAKAAGR